jgi:hypothetical protein
MKSQEDLLIFPVICNEVTQDCKKRKAIWACPAFWQLLRDQQLVFEDVFVREVELTADTFAKALEKMAFLAFGKVYWRQE